MFFMLQLLSLNPNNTLVKYFVERAVDYFVLLPIFISCWYGLKRTNTIHTKGMHDTYLVHFIFFSAAGTFFEEFPGGVASRLLSSSLLCKLKHVLGN